MKHELNWFKKNSVSFKIKNCYKRSKNAIDKRIIFKTLTEIWYWLILKDSN